jgi:hypothetical protein
MYRRHAECGGITWIPSEAKTEHIAVQCDACEDVFVISGEGNAVPQPATAEMDVR